MAEYIFYPHQTGRIVVADYGRWSKPLILPGAVLMLVAPFMPFARVPVASLAIPIPGILLNSKWLVVIAVFVLLGRWFPRRQALRDLVLALAALFCIVRDSSFVSEGIVYALRKAELSLASVNATLAAVGVPRIDLVPVEKDLASGGMWLAWLGVLMVLLGAGIELGGEIARCGSLSKYLSYWPGICTCGYQLAEDFYFCPQCGRALGNASRCPGCHNRVEEGFNFCPHCSRELRSE